MKRECSVVPILALLFAILPAVGMAEIDFTRYHNPSEIIGELERISATYPQVTRIHSIAESPGGLPVVILEIGPEVQIKEKTLPAVFVVADLEGTTPIAGEAALVLISQIVADPDIRADKSWYVLACSNPDAVSRFFEQPKFKDSRNSLPRRTGRMDSYWK